MSIVITGHDVWTIAGAIILTKLTWHLINGLVAMWRDAWRRERAKRLAHSLFEQSEQSE